MSRDAMREILYAELDELLDAPFTGSIELHCVEGEVRLYKVARTVKPGQTDHDRRAGERRKP